jgi:hypothetical protein
VTPQYVAQPNGYGCTVACLSMIVGTTYETMESWLLAQGLPRTRLEQGLWDGQYLEALDRHGFVYIRRYRCDPFINGQQRSEWPPRPFAPVHMLCVDVTAGHHAILMTNDGGILDPFKRERTTLQHPDYREIVVIVGVWPRSAP